MQFPLWIVSLVNGIDQEFLFSSFLLFVSLSLSYFLEPILYVLYNSASIKEKDLNLQTDNRI